MNELQGSAGRCVRVDYGYLVVDSNVDLETLEVDRKKGTLYAQKTGLGRA